MKNFIAEIELLAHCEKALGAFYYTIANLLGVLEHNLLQL
jgi:hypothetical protein